MKQYILPSEGKFYKANLHCHTVNSDGTLTPEELKKVYKDAGYSVLAYSDHNVLIDHSELDDEDFLALTSVEIDVSKPGDQNSKFRPCYHINFFHEDQHNVALPCFNPKYISKRHPDLRDAQKYVGEPDFTRDYHNINAMINEFAANGFIAMLNHPTWSLQTMAEYRELDTTNIFAMEMYNHGCNLEGYDEINCHIYDDLLCAGHKLYCTATDDNHNFHPQDSKQWDSCGGFVMIKSTELSQKAILQALKSGSFYASTGPEIKELYIEDGKLIVETSPVVKMALGTAARQAKVAYPDADQETITHAEFDLSNIYPGYIRLTVTDENGHFAWSQPIWGEYSGQY